MPPWSPDSAPDDALEPPGALECFDCGHRYDHLGRDPHPGRCPACGRGGVSPAGDLRRVGDLESVAAGPGDSTHRVDATDSTGRLFSYWLATLHGERAQLVRVGVGDALVAPTHDAWPARLDALVPDWLPAAAEASGLELVAPPAVLD